MNIKITTLFVWILAATLAMAEANIGKPAPAFEARDIEGKTHKLADYKGKIVVLESYNLDCPYVKNHYESGAMQELQSWAAEKGAVWLVVNSVGSRFPSHRTPEKAKAEWQQNKIKAAAWLADSDSSVARTYGMKTTPHMFVIDKDGNLAYQGAIDDTAKSSGDPRKARNYVRDAIDKLLAGQKPQPAETKPYGCGVKYAKGT